MGKEKVLISHHSLRDKQAQKQQHQQAITTTKSTYMPRIRYTTAVRDVFAGQPFPASIPEITATKPTIVIPKQLHTSTKDCSNCA